MSVPHTGHLTARIDGLICEFDGNHWSTPFPRLTAVLQQATDTSPQTHYNIKSLAEHILTKTGLKSRAEILTWRADQWPDGDIPDGAVD